MRSYAYVFCRVVARWFVVVSAGCSIRFMETGDVYWQVVMTVAVVISGAFFAAERYLER